MVDSDNSTFDMSIVEIFILILFVVVAYAITSIEAPPEQQTTDVDSLNTIIGDLENRIVEIDLERDSLEREMYGFIDSASVVNNIGTGRGSCWKKEGQSVSVMNIVMYDQVFKMQASWLPEFEQKAGNIIDDELFLKLSSGMTIEFTQSEFTQELQSVRSTGDNRSPPCFFISNIVDSTDSKIAYKNQKSTIERIFVTKEISAADIKEVE